MNLANQCHKKNAQTEKTESPQSINEHERYRFADLSAWFELSPTEHEELSTYLRKETSGGCRGVIIGQHVLVRGDMFIKAVEDLAKAKKAADANREKTR